MDKIEPADAHELARRARELGPREQESFVLKQCGDNVTLASQVFALIEQNTDGAKQWQGMPEDEACEAQRNPLIGARLGPYQLIKLLGSGGMGEVYLAQRIDAEFEHKVAIKLVRQSLLSESVRTRLRTERQILATLQHPNIATLLDGGTAPDGTPYLVMEYIEGVAIDIYCDRENLSIEQRLKLFLKVCAAVQCAHQRLIVHRDLKPSNILVTDEGEPKLLDFGIAKLLDSQLTPRTVAVTHHEVRMMTPAHASPEQVRGEMITTSSDIYVLGMLLYELLCGRQSVKMPANFRFADVERIVCTVTPPPPSVAVARTIRESPALMHDLAKCRGSTPQKLARRLQGDLDNIVLMALRKEPSRRYVSAEQFANDIRHWLEGLPVIATRDSWRYRTGKFIRRHTFGVTSLSSAALLLIAFSAVTYMQAKDIAKQRDAIAVERTRAEQISSFLVELFETADPSHSRGNEVRARDLLDAGERRIDATLGSQPVSRAMLLGTIGTVYRSLGLYQEASATLEKSLQTSLALYGENHAQVADALYGLGNVRIAQGNFDEAEQYLKRARTIQLKLHGANAVEQAPALQMLAWIAAERGDYAASKQQLQYALSLYDSHGQSTSVAKAKTLVQLGEVLSASYHEAEAEPLFRAALATEIPVLGRNDPHIAQVMSDLADALVSQKKFNEALPIFREALDIDQRVLGPDHDDLANIYQRYGDLLMRVGDYANAETVFTRALEIDRKALGEYHASVGYDHTNLGLLNYERGNYTAAEAEFQTAIDIFTRGDASTLAFIASPQQGLARCWVREGKWQQALPLLEKSTATIVTTMSADSPVAKKAQAALGIALVAAHRFDDARPLLTQTQSAVESYFGTQASISREIHDALERMNSPTAATLSKTVVAQR